MNNGIEYYSATGVVGSNKLKVLVTKASTGPEIGLNIMMGVTVNVFEADLDPWLATTDLAPRDEGLGTVKVAVKNPARVLVTVLGLVATGVPSNSIVIVELAPNPAPVTFASYYPE